MTKQELKDYVKLTAQLRCIEEQYMRLKAEIETPKRPILSDMPRGGKRLDLADKIAKLVDLQAEYNRQWDAAIDRRIKIEAAIDTLDDPTERMLLIYKYIDGLKWEDVCDKMHYSWRQIHRLHARALQKMA